MQRIWRCRFALWKFALQQQPSGWASDTTSRSAARQCSRITIFRFIWVSRLPLRRECKIRTSKCTDICIKKRNKLEARSKIFIIIWSFSYWPRQNICCIEGSISKKNFLRKKQYCSQESGQTVSGAKRIPLFHYTCTCHVCTCTWCTSMYNVHVCTKFSTCMYVI